VLKEKRDAGRAFLAISGIWGVGQSKAIEKGNGKRKNRRRERQKSGIKGEEKMRKKKDVKLFRESL